MVLAPYSLWSDGQTITTSASVLGQISRHRFRFQDEKSLQDGIEIVFSQAHIPYEREKSLSARDRPDFIIDGRIALEVKIKGTLSQALRQVYRYASHSGLSEIIVVGTPAWILRLPGSVDGTPLRHHRMIGSLL